MPVTVAAIEAELLVQIGPYLDQMGLDSTTANGTNASLRGAIRDAAWRMAQSGLLTVPPGDHLDLTDDDLVNVTRANYETLRDLALLKVLNVLWGNWPEFDMSAGSESQSLSQVADRLERRIKDLTARLGAVALPVGASMLPGPAAHGLIRTGRHVPGSLKPWYRGADGCKYYR
jgi:hypothetical protein